MISEDEFGLFLVALRFTAGKHSRQRRKDATRTPYINHPIQVADNPLQPIGHWNASRSTSGGVKRWSRACAVQIQLSKPVTIQNWHTPGISILPNHSPHPIFSVI